MNTITELIADLNGGLVHFGTAHAALAANVLRVDGTPGPDVFMITEAGADFVQIAMAGLAILTPAGQGDERLCVDAITYCAAQTFAGDSHRSSSLSY